jgi:hypothetical protein
MSRDYAVYAQSAPFGHPKLILKPLDIDDEISRRDWLRERLRTGQSRKRFAEHLPADPEFGAVSML